MSDFAKTGGITVVAIGIFAMVIFRGAACSAADEREATKAARAFTNDVLGLPGARVSCQGADTNNDGYVSCTVVADDRIIPLECAAWLTWGDSCRVATFGSVQVRK